MENETNIFREEQNLLDRKLSIALQNKDLNRSQNLIECGARIDSPIVTRNFDMFKLYKLIDELPSLIEKITEDDNNKELLSNVKKLIELSKNDDKYQKIVSERKKIL